MSSRYDELERLQRLRESGALTDEEFQAEKRRVLGHGGEPQEPAPAPTPVFVEEQKRSRLKLYLILGGVALLVAIVAGLLIGRMSSGDDGIVNLPMPEENETADANLVEAPAVPDVRTLPAGEQLARAFEAAFGARGSAIISVPSDGSAENVRYTPGKLIWPSYGPVLVSEGKIDDAPHVATGKIAVHYLKANGERFEVVRGFPAALSAGSFGQMSRWSVSSRFSNWPVVVAEGGGTWQGQTCSWLSLAELRPGGPVSLATVMLSSDNEGFVDDPSQATKIEGKILNVVRNQSFDVVYSGTRAFSEHWVRQGDSYKVAGTGESAMEGC
ncbi:MAG: SHOCT domain-containing protein [Allosphingosinicella sp.]